MLRESEKQRGKMGEADGGEILSLLFIVIRPFNDRIRISDEERDWPWWLFS